MLILEGMGTSRGIAYGKIVLIECENSPPEITEISSFEDELKRLNRALDTAESQIMELQDKANKDIRKEDASIFEIHAVMLHDQDYLDSITGIIRSDSRNAEYAVYLTGQQFSNNFMKMKDSYMKERATDVIDISRRLIHILTNKCNNPLDGVIGKVIIATEDLMPSQTIPFDKKKIAAFVTRNGSNASHSSILARSLGIPSVSALGDGFSKLQSGDYVIVDGIDGIVIINPDVITNAQYTVKQRDLAKQKERLKKLKGTSAVSKDGIRIELCANIGHPNDVSSVLENDADGIGLFRSEFIFLGRSDFPPEEVQFESYKSTLSAMKGKRVVVRTMDLGADKQASYLGISEEDNPALGYRAIRIQLDRTNLLITQLRALYRASVYGNLAIMFPMIVSVSEIQIIKKLTKEVQNNLKEDGIPFSPNVELGIMVETPSAAVTADRLAAEVDFFSIGTNDLTQYMLAADRMNSKVSYLFDSGHVSVLRMIRYITQQAHKHGIWVSICGESAADLNLSKYYLYFGVDELSVSTPSILELKEKIQSITVSTLREDIDKYLD